MVLYYIDIKTGDRILVAPGDLELRILQAEGDYIIVEHSDGMKKIRTREDSSFGTDVILYNFGGRGKRRVNHVKLTMPENYVCEREREGERKKIELVKNVRNN